MPIVSAAPHVLVADWLQVETLVVYDELVSLFVPALEVKVILAVLLMPTRLHVLFWSVV